jgi:hypothetical protein
MIDVNSDMAAAFPLLAAWVLATRAGSVAEAAFLFPSLCAVGVACKANVAPAVLVLTIALSRNRLRSVLLDRRALIGAAGGILLAVLLCVGSYLPVYRLFGDLIGGSEGWGHSSLRQGPSGQVRAALFGTLHWSVEPSAIVPEPPRFELLDDLGVGRAYLALGAGTREKWYPWVDPTTNRSGVFPFLALPWLVAALPKGKRLRGGLFFSALLLAVFAPVAPNCYASRFAVVLLAAFAVLWGLFWAKSPRLVTALLLAALIVDIVFLRTPGLTELAIARKAPEKNARIAAAVGSHTLWLLSGSMSSDAEIAGRRADVHFEYLSCPRDGNWVRRFAEIQGRSPWLLLGNNAPRIATGPWYSSAFGPPCPGMLVTELQSALTEAGWRLAFEEFGYQIWRAERDNPKSRGENVLSQPTPTRGGI